MSLEFGLRDVEAFVTVVDEGSFTAAARRLGVNQSVVSTRIAHLEAELGVRVLDRGARRSNPTPAGAALAGRARALLGQAADLVRLARRIGEVAEGILEIAASTVPGTFYLPAVLGELRSQAPGLLVDMTLSDSDAALAALRAGRVELAVIGREVADDDVEAEILWTDAVILVASRELAARVPAGGTIVDLPVVLRRGGSATRRVVVDALERLGVRERELEIALLAPDNEVAKEAALAGLGAAFLSERAAERDLRAGRLVRLDRLFPPLLRPLCMVRLAGRTPSAGGRLLAELLRARAR